MSNKWYKRRHNDTEDIRKYIPSNGRILKSNIHSKDKKWLKKLAGSRTTNQLTLLETLSPKHVQINTEPAVTLASSVSQGIRKKAPQDDTPITVTMEDAALSCTSTGHEYHPQSHPSPLAPSPISTDVNEEVEGGMISQSNKDTNNENGYQDGAVSLPRSLPVTRPFTESYSSATLDSDELSCSPFKPSQLSPSSVLRVLNCDTEEFINNL